MLVFLFVFDVFVSGAGAMKIPAVPGGPGVFIAPCVSVLHPASLHQGSSGGFGIFFRPSTSGWVFSVVLFLA